MYALFSPVVCLGLTVTARRYVLADSNASSFATELDNRHVNESISIDPATTALVLIDVWNDSYSAGLSENENARLIPLLQAARELGMLIVHAPSEAPEWPAIKVLPGEVLVTGVDGHPGSSSRCDVPILNSSRGIKHVLVAGYDTNKCVIDKPCGAVALSTELLGKASLIFVRDATRGEYGWYGNSWYGQMATIEMLELGWWLPSAQRGIPSVLLADILLAAGATTNATDLPKLNYPAPSAEVISRTDFVAPPPMDGTTGMAGLVVVSCSSDYTNQGFRARVLENRARYLEPLLLAWRKHTFGGIIHAPNGHVADGACAPRPGEDVVTTNDQFDALVDKYGIKTLYYVGYAANTDMLFGVGGMQRFYSNQRYLGMAVPSYFWVDEATIGLESSETLVDGWAKKAAMGYRQPLLRGSRPYHANVVTSAALLKALCDAAPKGGPILYRLEGEHTFRSAADAIEYDDVAGSCGPSMIGQASVTIEVVATPAAVGPSVGDSKLLCFVKTVGTPFAVYQLKMDGAGNLLYQTASSKAWTGTLSAPRVFAAANQTVKVTVVHSGRSVSVYRNGTLVTNSSDFAALDYSYAHALLIGKRLDSESWNGRLGNVLIREGSWHPRATSLLPAQEVAALQDLHDGCGGSAWKYRLGTDAVGGGAPWGGGSEDPCSTGWFGVRCNADGTHVTQLFPNTRFSGNELDCVLPDSIGNLSALEHLYTSNDRTPSSLHGSIPTTLGRLTGLKCLYLSHNNLTGAIPTELQRLTKLQVFLMRCNQLTGPLIDFSPLKSLKNVWFDTNKALTGSLGALGELPSLTFLQASNNPGLQGDLPSHLCSIHCDAAGTSVNCSSTLPAGCCGIKTCGAAPPAPPPPPSSMGECFPQ